MKVISDGSQWWVIGKSSSGLTARALWTPADITTKLWLDASDASTIFEDDTAGDVSKWTDKSGNGGNVTQATLSRQPTIATAAINGLNAISPQSRSQWLENLTFNNTFASVQIISVASLASTADPYKRVYTIKDSGTVDGLSLRQNSMTSSLQAIIDSDSSGALYPGYASGGYLVPFLSSQYYDGSNLYQNLDGTLKTTTAVTGNILSDTILIGSDGGSYSWDDGFIGEIVILANTDETMRHKVEGYLAWKWGLEANLPNDHPYKSAAP